MKSINNIKLGNKILLGFALVLVLMVLSILMSYVGFRSNSKEFQTYESIINLNTIASRIQTTLLNSRIQYKSYVSTGDEKYIAEFNNYFSQMNDLISQGKSNIKNQERVDKIEQIYKYAQEYKLDVDSIVEYNRKRTEITEKVLAVKGGEIQKNLSLIMDNLEGNNASIIANKVQEYLLAARIHAIKYVLHDNSEEIDAFNKDYKEFNIWLSKLNDATKGNKNADIVNSIYLDKTTYYDSFIRLISLTEQRNNFNGRLDTIGPNISNLAEEIKKSITKEQEAFAPKIQQANNNTLSFMLAISIIATILSVIVALRIKDLVLNPVEAITDTFEDISKEEVDLNLRLNVKSEDEMGQLALWFNNFMKKLQVMMEEKEKLSWIRNARAELNDKIRGEQEIQILSNKIVAYICNLVGAKVGALYIIDEDKDIRLTGRYSWIREQSFKEKFKPGEGLVGQVFLDKKPKLINNIPDGYMSIASSIGKAAPANVLIVPCIYNDEVKCVIEIGTFEEFKDIHLEFLKQASDNIAISVNSQQTRKKLQTLLEKSMEMSEELQLQQEELRNSNEELEKQAKVLKESEAMLQAQQEELRVTNEELEDKTKSLEKQKKEMEKKAEQLELANKYKSEFLANVSHELKTPLNSILILSELLSQKKDLEPLTPKQLEFSKTINSSGKDLLSLINDILDLSKVEAGKMDIYTENMPVSELVEHMEDMFRPVANSKDLELSIQVDTDIPKTIYTDSQRIRQILRNLLSNAFKFTDIGGVYVNIRRPEKGIIFNNKALSLEDTIGIFIRDTGIGIPKDKQEIIFDAFKQVDGTTSRKYGGTGLGLSISRQIAKLLGGEIQLVSEEGKGSTFIVYIPEKLKSSQASISDEEEIIGSEPLKESLKFEYGNHMSEEIKKHPAEMLKKEGLLIGKKILIVDDDMRNVFALTNFLEKNGMQVTVGKNGKEAIEKLNKSSDINLIIMDVMMPEMDGYEAMRKIRAKDKFAKIPIIALTAKTMAEDRKNCIDAGASDYMVKPVDYEKLMSLLKVWLY